MPNDLPFTFDDDPVGPWPGHVYPEDTVEEGLDLPRVSGGHPSPSDSLDVRETDAVLIDFTQPEPEGEIFVVLRVRQNEAPLLPPVVLGVVRARNLPIATVLARVQWAAPTADLWIDDRAELARAILSTFVTR